MRGMKFRPPPMQPAFSGTGHLVVWIAALAAILLSPILTALIVSPETRYLVMSKRVGPSDWHTNQVLKETGPLDILVLGNSRMLMAINHAALRQDVHAPDGPLKSETIAARFNGYDLSYTFLKDFFIHRHARLVVINYPDIPQIDNHPGEKYIRTLGQPDPGLDIKTPALAITDYAEMAMIGPRLALASIIRPGIANAATATERWRIFLTLNRREAVTCPTRGTRKQNLPLSALRALRFSGQTTTSHNNKPRSASSCRGDLDRQAAHPDRIRLSSRNQNVMRKKWRHPCFYAAANGE